ncbi:hypothetical protein GO988_15480 [Hymenobacter sp. HMF4947]|uniref:Phage major capsid protein n=1 Tax=Hymenobacter ginkgonis TaxID=2682976 RepID=A0A7K1TH73_9BACT|nr:hypothetical protein [Hymenobacter ginkgonis]MVN77734.1 hypothetical protein [Hymenobacter ginkgonis]
MTIAAIIAEFGAYYLNNGQNATRLVRLLFRPAVTEQLFVPRVSDDTLYQASQTRLGRILQPFHKNWTPLGALEALPIVIKQFKMKADLEETPDDLEATWLGFLAGDSLNRTEWPFVRWFIEVHALPQIQEDYELNEIYLGKRVEPNGTTPGAAGTAMDGIRTQINGFITAGRTTPVVLGAIPTDPKAFCEYVEAFAHGTLKRYRNVPMFMSMNEDLALRYAIGRDAKYNLATTPVVTATPDGNDPLTTSVAIQHSRQRVIGLPSMGDSPKIWMTPADNAIRLAKKTQNMGQFQVESVDRKVKLFTDFYKGVGFLIPQAIFTNDQDLDA